MIKAHYIIIVLLVFLQSSAVYSQNNTWVESDHFLPANLYLSKITFQKFSPIYLQDLNAEDLRIMSSKMDKKTPKSFREHIDYYNEVVYVVLNRNLENSIKQYPWKSQVRYDYLRDLQESNYKDTRFVVYSESTFATFYSASISRSPIDFAFTYRLVDTKTGIKYKAVNSLEVMLELLDYYYLNVQSNKLTQDKLDQQCEKRVKKGKRKEPKNKQPYIQVDPVTSIGLALAIIATIIDSVVIDK